MYTYLSIIDLPGNGIPDGLLYSRVGVYDQPPKFAPKPSSTIALSTLTKIPDISPTSLSRQRELALHLNLQPQPSTLDPESHCRNTSRNPSRNPSRNRNR